ncbi:MAG: dihydroneopterin aldolase [Verrucomicrobiales bacterium]|nr:dihydroneopterin aldolase [Verrucomicrobiales bacterium]
MKMEDGDKITIKGLQISSQVGVPDEERAQAQDLTVDLGIYPQARLSGLQDEIERTIDYYQVSLAVHEVARAQQRRLIERLAEDIAVAVLGFDGVGKVAVEVKKYILPDTEYVSVCLVMDQNDLKSAR